MRVYSLSYWLVIFCTTNSSRVLARERWQIFENSWKKTQYLMNTLYFVNQELAGSSGQARRRTTRRRSGTTCSCCSRASCPPTSAPETPTADPAAARHLWTRYAWMAVVADRANESHTHYLWIVTNSDFKEFLALSTLLLLLSFIFVLYWK